MMQHKAHYEFFIKSAIWFKSINTMATLQQYVCMQPWQHCCRRLTLHAKAEFFSTDIDIERLKKNKYWEYDLDLRTSKSLSAYNLFSLPLRPLSPKTSPKISMCKIFPKSLNVRLSQTLWVFCDYGKTGNCDTDNN